MAFPRRARLLCLAPVFVCAAALSAATPVDPTYAALRAARPQGPGLSVANLVLERDVFRFKFESGVFQLLAPVEGRAFGAVFVGRGSVDLSPATEAERRQLALETGQKGLEILSDRFEELVLLFSDGTAKEIEARSSAAPPSPHAAAAYETFFAKQRKDLRRNLQVRLLADALKSAGAGSGFFLASFKGKTLSAALAVVDPAGLDWLSSDLGAENSTLYVIDDADGDFWYLSARKSDLAAKPAPTPPPARATRYRIETTIAKNTDIRGTTTLELADVAPELRVLPVHLLPGLRLKEVSVAPAGGDGWLSCSFIQENEKEDAGAAVVFPASGVPGNGARLRFSYEGKDVLQNAGDGNFVVGARESWYPNLGVFRDLAAFELVYRFPKAYQIVSVGRLLEEKTEGEERVSIWRTESPIRVAGFNYGKFKKYERADKESGFEISVYTNTGTPNIIREINMALEARAAGGGSGVFGESTDGDFSVGSRPGLQAVHIDVDGLADSAIADGINTARIATSFFGPLSERHIAITQQTQAFFGQSWPSLIYLPYIAALDGTTRHELGLGGTADFIEVVGPHEFAHQWWGHLVGWKSYRDQWLSEGFAEFSASLVLQATGGVRRFNGFWEKARRWILTTPRQSSVSNDAAAPISQGWRASTRHNRAAGQAMIYSKGAYVLHMLRMMMRDYASPKADENFALMMRDFATTYSGKNPSTADFQAVVERHMTPWMNGGGDGTMNWFFRQWVYGTEIPRYRAKLDIVPQGDRYHLTGTVAQEGVGPEFRSLAHLYVEFPKGEIAHLGTLPLSGLVPRTIDAVVKLPKAPKRALLNAYHDVLSRD